MINPSDEPNRSNISNPDSERKANGSTADHENQGSSSADMNAIIVDLKKQRTSMKKSLTNIAKKVDEESGTSDTTILQCRLEILETYFKQACYIQGKIEALCPTDAARSDIEENFISTKAKLLRMINSRRGSMPHDHSFLSQTNVGCASNSRLPSLKLPKFDGKYAEYKRFIAAFKHMVDENSSITTLEKFDYLLNCLSGSALAVVEPFQVNDANYYNALKRLEERYDNTVLIFLEHITTLFKVPNMPKDDSSTLRYIIDTVAAIRGSLLSLGSEMEVLNGLLIHIVLSKLDDQTKKNYDEKQDFKTLPSWDYCYELLSRRCQFLESHGKREETQSKLKTPGQKKSNFNRSSHTFVNFNSNCAYCNSLEHNISSCSSFSSLIVPERFNFIKRNGHCINCLRKGHVVSKCPSKSRCRECQSSHHTILHRFSESDHAIEPSPSTHRSTEIQANPTSFLVRARQRAIIPTAVVLVQDSCGSFQPVRTLLDSCSEINFISEETAKRLKLKFYSAKQEVSGIGDVRAPIKFEVMATIKSRTTEFEWSSIFLVAKTISARQPGEQLEIHSWKLPKDIKLADPLFHKPQRIDMLISAEVFFDLLLDGRIVLGDGLPSLTNTVFGWIVGGSYRAACSTTTPSCNLAISPTLTDIDSTLKRFWEIEEYIQSPDNYTQEESECEQHFMETVCIGKNNRIQVRLPFKKSPQCLGNSFDMAKRRFLSIEKRLERDSLLKSMYIEFMDEYQTLRHMSPYTGSLTGLNYVIPHHCVLRPQSTTTKLRVVFDASARSSSNFSLNDILMVGPTIQQDLITTLFSFRMHKYALTADISKMYRQFQIDKRDAKFQLILWRNNKDDELRVYQLDTVTYGLCAAPFLAIRCLFFIADRYKDTYPLGSQVLRQDLYVDDVLTGADNIPDLLAKRSELVQILKYHGLDLAKWHSNQLDIAINQSPETIINTPNDDPTKTLGMSWKPHSDMFCFRYNFPEIINPTKRSILSLVAQIYDVLGIISPIVIRCKILLQELWMQQTGWDDTIDGRLKDIWNQIYEDLQHISDIKVPRYVLTSANTQGEIHGFADASQRAYGCCIYYRVFVDGVYKTHLLIAKSKVAPIKVQTLPRLELNAAILLSRTWIKIKPKMQNYTSSVYFWSDSSIVLQWLRLHSSTLQCFVANRVSELQQNSHGIIWRHVPTKSNPADIVSRGCSAKELSDTIWFSGPSFLKECQLKWPKSAKEELSDVVLERKKASVFKCTLQKSEVDEIIAKHSSFYHILRIFTYIFRFFNRSPPNKSVKSDIAQTFWHLISLIQSDNYKDDIAAIGNGKLVHPSLQKLTPFLHDTRVDGKLVKILRVGGRLSNAPIPYDARFPALLPKEHLFVKLYIEYLHRLHKHAGPKVLLGIMRQKIWVINGREIVRKVVRRCVHCFRYKPILMNQIMGNLPADRLRSQRPFLVSGVDFCGPFKTTYRIRGKQPYKTYIAVFVCFSSKATHLELVSDLSTNNFILCLKRFVGRRGVPNRLYCDNATNFVGGHNKLTNFKSIFFQDAAVQQMQTYAAQKGFEFVFIPPRAPHFGGLWEAAVKSAKTLLLKNAGFANLTYEELHTLIIEIEAILNSRPIAPMSDDPNDGEALTPGHLLIGSALIAMPDETLNMDKPGLLTRWQRITYLKQQFWNAWSRDYLTSLQERSKWLTPRPDIAVGQLVLIHEDNTPPQLWHLGRVTKTIKGKDERVRVVELTTKNGNCCRPIHKIALIPSQN